MDFVIFCELTKPQLNVDSDIVVLMAYYLLTYKSFRCLGNGYGKELKEEEIGSIDLPKDWNTKKNVYSIRYIGGTKRHVYNLCGTVQENNVILTLLYGIFH
ncbi:proteasome inhibitor PI31 subunit-like isoform X2 [Contarinia nasturtii]|uniref:proteasome inhibitor PI31 subunit-like isoform X2 n=1 Tax=Contarinia nasturtii TaxID=265458 RepID=UPI0012D4A709|nr:proteasome inhibitor PI31 subunit-like isoform X2 [Contarinia nasturtii]